ncbi:low molecular weight protein-tyrosine-phosphatase [Tetragenococcus solitarius]|uniref:protein-tyrosine-phosphatase n=1 Tax=Tetragenococcus solitarius TaxID=71453 RepID=A0ABN3Y319_9ENTE|nr:low molecular weight protein-tyrosine-phosphatase [Tetragenococcus solitarius]
MPKVLFVCLGNICRSPMAEGLMRQYSKERGYILQIDSAGTSSWEEGNLPHPGTQAILKREGVDFTTMHSRPITKEDFYLFDWIIGMDKRNMADLLELAPNGMENKIYLYMDAIDGKQGQEIPDPWYSGQFEKTYQMLMEGMKPWLIRFKEEA